MGFLFKFMFGVSVRLCLSHPPELEATEAFPT